MGKTKFNVEAAANADLKIEEKEVYINETIGTIPARGEKDVDVKITPRVTFKKETMKASTLTPENVYLEDRNGNKVPCTIDSGTGTVALIIPDSPLAPSMKYYFKFGRGLRNANGKKAPVSDNSICFTTAAV